MRKFSKRVLALTLCTAMVFACGCSKKEEGNKKEAKSASEYVKLCEYKPVTVKSSELDEYVQGQIDQTLAEYTTYKEVKKGKVKDGDTVNIYYVGRMNGKKFDGGACTKKDTPEGHNLTIGSHSFIDGFEEGLIGAKVGDTVKVDTQFPKEYPQNPDYAGKKAVFTVTVNYIQGEAIVPEVTDEFVKKNLTTYDSADDFKNTLREYGMKELAWTTVQNGSTIEEYPQNQIDEMYNQLYTSITYYLQQSGYALSDYLEAQQTTEDAFKEQLKNTAKEDVGRILICKAIAEAEKISVSDEEYKKELENYITNYNVEDEAALDELFKNYYGTDAKSIIVDDMLFQKVKDFLAENAKEE